MARVVRDPWREAVEHLVAADPRFGPIVERVGPCQLRPRSDRFGTLVRAIIGQQISSKAAATIDGRLQVLSGEPHDPVKILALGEDGLRSVGLSGMKSRYVLSLSDEVASRRLDLKRLHRHDDETIITELTRVKGIGRWTAEMFLIFSLNRPDVLPVADLGIRVGLRDHHNLADLPKPAQCIELAAPWRPFRSVAMWYLWRSLDGPKAATTATAE